MNISIIMKGKPHRKEIPSEQTEETSKSMNIKPTNGTVEAPGNAEADETYKKLKQKSLEFKNAATHPSQNNIHGKGRDSLPYDADPPRRR